MSPKVRDVSDRKTLYMSDLRKEGKIPVRFNSFFESVNNSGQWIADLEWRGERRYFEVDGEIDRKSFKRLPENLEIEIESVGRPGIDKVAIWKDSRRVDLHAQEERVITGELAGNSLAESPRSAPTPITLDQVFSAYAKAYRKALPMVAELDPTGENGLTADKIVSTVLPAYIGANIASRRRPRPPGGRSPNPADGSQPV
jgi:hypothetical protein